MASVSVKRAVGPIEQIALVMSLEEARYLLFWIDHFVSTGTPDGPVQGALRAALEDADGHATGA